MTKRPSISLGYWNENGAYQEEYDLLWNQVPMKGRCSTDELELLRAAAYIYYRYYNDGDLPSSTWKDRSHIYLFQNPNVRGLIEEFVNSVKRANKKDLRYLLECFMDAVVNFAYNPHDVSVKIVSYKMWMMEARGAC